MPHRIQPAAWPLAALILAGGVAFAFAAETPPLAKAPAASGASSTPAPPADQAPAAAVEPSLADSAPNDYAAFSGQAFGGPGPQGFGGDPRGQSSVIALGYLGGVGELINTGAGLADSSSDGGGWVPGGNDGSDGVAADGASGWNGPGDGGGFGGDDGGPTDF